MGFTIISLSDLIKEEIKARGKIVNKRNMFFETANAMRRNAGNYILAQIAVEKIFKERIQKFVVEGIRVVEEVKYLKRIFDDFLLIGMKTSLEERLRRVKSRNREIDSSQSERIY